MKKFMMGAKASLGMANKTEDPEYDKYHAAIQGLTDALEAYKSAAKTMEKAAVEMSAALKKVAKSMTALAEGDGASAGQKSAASKFVDASETIENHYLKAYKDELICKDLEKLQHELDEEKKLNGPRSKWMSEYDVYREAVATKESEYAKKNKPLTESKLYNEQVATRDSNKKEFEAADKAYKAQCEKIMKMRIPAINEGMISFLKGSSTFLSNIEKDLANCAKEIKK